MTDPRLSKQQQGRIDDARAERLAPWLQRHETGSDGTESGVVVSHLRKQIEVAPSRGAPDAHLRCFLRATMPAVVSGDRVLFERDAADPSRGVITAALPRLSLLARHTARGLRPVCANLDLLLVTIAPQPAPHADLIDRYLCAAHLDDLGAAIILNKADLIATNDAADIDALLAPYAALGVPIVRTSTAPDARVGIAELADLIAGRAAAFVGQSGVGKSSLINALIPSADAETGALSRRQNRGRSRGRHTTSTTRLYRTDDAVIIDSPGIREFAADVPDEATLTRGFPELATLAGDCRFRDCRHEQEPDCAILAALADGRLAPSRLRSFRILRDELLERR